MSTASGKAKRQVDEEATEVAAVALTALSISSQADNDDEDGFEIPQRFTKSGRKRAVPFPVKLMKVLSDKKFSEIICWTPSGKAFNIMNPKAFASEILPEHFKSAKYSSFTRKLHRWGFMRHYRGEEAGAFYHKDFQRDRLDLVEKMTCKADAPQPKAPAAIAANKPSPIIAPKKATNLAQPAPPVQRQEPAVQATIPNVPIQAPAHPPANVVASHLDAAIEAEVTRRLQERIQQAALSRMFMQQQLNNNAVPLALRLQLMEMQQKKLNSLGGPLVPLTGSHNPNTSGNGLDQMPESNVQGAKTA
eukprot:CAMPEP_0176131936 /NCGR_PEP_ID=MMETSP0120_2-20121206/66810_1 /TAXON_ID=160619 /ORGANISM="Kryptoperidinium foliaceum, Strain CCMP 1326" /LENGTH=304 /DNA_ID=CAMNT_0017467353 /DNA_START=118 /DNA_END=1032 /DNA_ORIENTATION=+